MYIYIYLYIYIYTYTSFTHELNSSLIFSLPLSCLSLSLFLFTIYRYCIYRLHAHMPHTQKGSCAKEPYQNRSLSKKSSP